MYAYFAGKEALLVAAHNEGFRILLREKLAVASKNARDPLNQLCEGGLIYLRFAFEQPGLYRLIFSPPLVKGLSRDLFATDPGAECLTVLRSAVTACQKEGDLPGMDAAQMAFVLWSAVHGAAALLLLGRAPGQTKPEFEPTTATQVIATQTPAMMFAATTPVGCCLWARAYDAYTDGHMEMRAKVASTLTVMNESSTEALNRTSLRRWLLESPLYPVALLPGGPVRWEAIDDKHAKAIVSAFGLEESLIATFDADGSLASFNAVQDGDLTTPYHGAGEHVTRSDYRLVAGMMIPHAFEISRAAKGKILPFWKGRITAIEFK